MAQDGSTKFHLTEEEIASHGAEQPGLSSLPPYPPVVQRFATADNDNEAHREFPLHKNVGPVVVIVVGMAGSGKTTLISQLYQSLQSNNQQHEQQHESVKRGYFVNLDPATRGDLPYGASIDIRDTVNYAEVMKQYGLGPNGAIMTSLNLFATKFDQVMAILERRGFHNSSTGGGGGDGDCQKQEAAAEAASATVSSSTHETTTPQDTNNNNNNNSNNHNEGLDYIIIDTPGQIEAFTWSASGTILSESLASSFPTILTFVLDTPRCASSPHTFMSNMLYACSIMYRTKLPLLVVFHKVDVVPAEVCRQWMEEYEVFQEALDECCGSGGGGGMDEAGYYGSLTRSLSLVLDEFYAVLRHCATSAVTGEGTRVLVHGGGGGGEEEEEEEENAKAGNFWVQVDAAAVEFVRDYVPDLKQRVDERRARVRAKARRDVRRLQRDVAADDGKKGKGGGS